MFPKIQMSRQARWLRFWQGAPVWVLASRSRCAFSPLDKSSWERCEGSIQFSFCHLILLPASLWLHSLDYAEYWTPLPLHFLVWISHSLMAFPTTLIKITHSPLHHLGYHHPSSSSVFSLSVVFETTVWWYFSEQASGKAEQVWKFLQMPVIDLHYYKGIHCL